MGHVIAEALRVQAASLRAQAAVLDTQAEALDASAGAVERWATARDNPLGTPRTFLEAARRGAFETFRRGRETSAKWSDVDAYIERNKIKRKARTSHRASPDDRARANLRRAKYLPTA